MGCGASAKEPPTDSDVAPVAQSDGEKQNEPEKQKESEPEKQEDLEKQKSDDVTLPEYKAPPPPKIDLPEIQGDHYIKVQCITGQTVTQKVNLTDTIRVLKARLAQTEGGPLEGQRFRLVFDGRDLPATEMVGQANLAKGSLVMAVLLRVEIGELECPEAGGRAHFTGCLMHDRFVHNWCSVPYEEDQYSEYVGVGRYPDNQKAFPKAIATTFDAIAVDAGTRVTVYSQKDFKGEVLWDRVGPAIVCNTHHTHSNFDDGTGNNGAFTAKLFGQWREPLNTVFPPEVREFSESNMHAWPNGSVIITGGQEIPLGCMRLQDYASNSKKELS